MKSLKFCSTFKLTTLPTMVSQVCQSTCLLDQTQDTVAGLSFISTFFPLPWAPGPHLSLYHKTYVHNSSSILSSKSLLVPSFWTPGPRWFLHPQSCFYIMFSWPSSIWTLCVSPWAPQSDPHDSTAIALYIELCHSPEWRISANSPGQLCGCGVQVIFASVKEAWEYFLLFHFIEMFERENGNS